MNEKMISVIIPIYNSEKYLSKCIESICRQTYKKLEIILINDGSSDGCSDICKHYKKMDDRIVVIEKNNEGQASSRNLGIDIAKGDYIGFVDSDDWIEPDMYERLITAIEDYDLSICGRYNVDEKSGEKRKIFTSNQPLKFNHDELIKSFLMTDMIDGSPCDKLFKKELIGSIRFPEGYICEDLPFVFNVIILCHSAIQIGIPLYNYLQREGSTSKSSYNHKTLGLYKYPYSIYKLIKSSYPELEREASIFFYNRALCFFELYELSDKKEKISNKLSWNAFRFLSFKKKIKFLLIKFHLYAFVKKIIG